MYICQTLEFVHPNFAPLQTKKSTIRTQLSGYSYNNITLELSDHTIHNSTCRRSDALEMDDTN